MSSDLETRAREAASAARVSVMSAAAYVNGAEPAFRRPTAHLGAVVMATIVILGGATALFVSRDKDTTRITTGPAESPATLLPARPGTTPPPPGPPPQSSIGPVVGTGTAKGGRQWTLAIGGPSNELCFQFEDSSGGVCAGRPGGAPVPADKRYQPLLFQDQAQPAFVFGLVPAGVAEVEVELVTGGTKTRTRVMTCPSDGCYAVEVDRPDMATAVIGYRTDGTTLRYALPR